MPARRIVIEICLHEVYSHREMLTRGIVIESSKNTRYEESERYLHEAQRHSE